jgi:DNA-binding LacI/PurR family transcriptional regulator
LPIDDETFLVYIKLSGDAKMVTIKEIAHRANVSIATVSNILNQTGRVSDETARKVLEIVEELHYTPNFNARSLKRNSSLTIGIITEDLTVFNTPEIVDGINACCSKNHYHFILANMRVHKRFGPAFTETDEYAAFLRDEINVLLSKQVAGIIYVGCHYKKLSCLPLIEQVPITIAYSYTDHPEIQAVLFDDEQAAYDATRLLIANGHKKIGVLAGLKQSINTQERLLGYQKALFESQLLYNPDLISYGDWSQPSGYQGVRMLYEQGVRAFFGMNDFMASGAYLFANEQGLVVGRDLSMIGFDNREISTAYNPALSTIDLPLFEMGWQVTKCLLDRIEKKSYATADSNIIRLKCVLLSRASVFNACQPSASNA